MRKSSADKSEGSLVRKVRPWGPTPRADYLRDGAPQHSQGVGPRIRVRKSRRKSGISRNGQKVKRQAHAGRLAAVPSVINCLSSAGDKFCFMFRITFYDFPRIPPATAFFPAGIILFFSHPPAPPSEPVSGQKTCHFGFDVRGYCFWLKQTRSFPLRMLSSFFDNVFSRNLSLLGFSPSRPWHFS